MEEYIVKETTEQFVNTIRNRRVNHLDINDTFELVNIVMDEFYPGMPFDIIIKELFLNSVRKKIAHVDREYYAKSENWVEVPDLPLFGPDAGGFRLPEYMPIGDKRKNFKKVTVTQSIISMEDMYTVIEHDVEELAKAWEVKEQKRKEWLSAIKHTQKLSDCMVKAGYDPDKMTYEELYETAKKNNVAGKIIPGISTKRAMPTMPQ